MTGTQVRDESKRALFGWSPPDLPADTALKRRADRLLPRTGWAAVLYCAAVIGLLNLAPHLPERGNLAVDGLAALAAAAWCGLNFWRCRHAHCIVTSTGWAALSQLAFTGIPLRRDRAPIVIAAISPPWFASRGPVPTLGRQGHGKVKR